MHANALPSDDKNVEVLFPWGPQFQQLNNLCQKGGWMVVKVALLKTLLIRIKHTHFDRNECTKIVKQFHNFSRERWIDLSCFHKLNNKYDINPLVLTEILLLSLHHCHFKRFYSIDKINETISFPFNLKYNLVGFLPTCILHEAQPYGTQTHIWELSGRTEAEVAAHWFLSRHSKAKSVYMLKHGKERKKKRQKANTKNDEKRLENRILFGNCPRFHKLLA